MNLLVFRVVVEGYFFGEVGFEVIVDFFKEYIEREFGFRIMVLIFELGI